MSKNIITIVLLVGCSGISYSEQVCNFNKFSPTAPNNRYEIISNGMEVKDKKTNLVWQRCSLGKIWNGITCSTVDINNVLMSWTDALKTQDTQWRIPNVKELISLKEWACITPSINESIFPNTGGRYWTSSPDRTSSYDKPQAIFVAFGGGGGEYGHGFIKAPYEDLYNVRLVRDVIPIIGD